MKYLSSQMSNLVLEFSNFVRLVHLGRQITFCQFFLILKKINKHKIGTGNPLVE